MNTDSDQIDQLRERRGLAELGGCVVTAVVRFSMRRTDFGPGIGIAPFRHGQRWFRRSNALMR